MESVLNLSKQIIGPDSRGVLFVFFSQISTEPGVFKHMSWGEETHIKAITIGE